MSSSNSESEIYDQDRNPWKPSRIKTISHSFLLARPRLVLSVAIGLASFFLIPLEVAQQSITKAIIAWNIGSGFYLILAMEMMFWSSHERFRKRAMQCEFYESQDAQNRNRTLRFGIFLQHDAACFDYQYCFWFVLNLRISSYRIHNEHRISL